MPMRQTAYAFPVLFLAAASVLAQWQPANPAYQTGFPVAASAGAWVNGSSVSLGDLTGDGLPDIVVGTVDGVILAYSSAGALLWRYPSAGTLTMGIESKAAIADLDLDGEKEVVIGAGSTFTPSGDGVLLVLNANGTLSCSFTPLDTFGSGGHPDGVFSSPAVADLVTGDGGLLEIAFGSFDRRVRVIEHDCSLPVVWERNVFDSVFSSPAIGDINRDGQLDVVIGSDADANTPGIDHDGGFLHVYDGRTGDELPGFPIATDEVVWSAPTLGDLTGDGGLEIVVGTGYCWASPTCPTPRTHPGVGEYVSAWDRLGNPLPGWPFLLNTDHYVFGSPALADVDEDGAIEAVFNTLHKTTNEGLVYVVNGDGTVVPGWPKAPQVPASCAELISQGTAASPVVADLDGDGHLEIVIASNSELVAFDRFGNQLTRGPGGVCPEPASVWQLRNNFSVNSTPAVGDLDGDGDLELVLGGANDSATQAAVYAWDFVGAAAPGRLPWPQFRRSRFNDGLSQFTLFLDGFESGDLAAWSANAP